MVILYRDNSGQNDEKTTKFFKKKSTLYKYKGKNSNLCKRQQYTANFFSKLRVNRGKIIILNMKDKNNLT
jgi:hypothetical protein